MTTAEIKDEILVCEMFCKYAMLDCVAEDVLFGFTRLRQLREELALAERYEREGSAA